MFFLVLIIKKFFILIKHIYKLLLELNILIINYFLILGIKKLKFGILTFNYYNNNYNKKIYILYIF